MTERKKLRLALVLAVLVIAGVGAAAGLQALRRPEREIPTARVKRGNLELKVYTTGELRAGRSAMLVAPPVGGTLQIIYVVKTGTMVKDGDMVVEFDPAEQEYNLEQARSELLQAEQEITKLKADAAVQGAQDQVALLSGTFDVRRAELEVSRNELVSAIDAKKNLLTLEEARRHLAQLEQDIHSREASNQASLAVAEEKRNKARLTMQQAQKNIENMKLRAPLSGLVAVKENWDASGGFFFPGMVLPEYREGDLVFPGRFIAEVLEVNQMEILAKVSETDRADVTPGQPVEVLVDTLPGPAFRGKVKTVAGLASRGFFSGDPMRRFDATFQLDQPDARLRPGVTTQVIIIGDEVRDALYVPRQALFEKDGKLRVFVRTGARFEPREVKVRHRTESQVVVEGLSEGTEVALVNPEEQNSKTAKAPARPGSLGGGGR